MSTVPFGDPSGQYVPWLSVEYLEHVVPAGAKIVNYRKCKLCEGVYLPDSSGSGICGREFCRLVREAWAKEDAARAALSAAGKEMLA
jgi:hypothetical protein